jgi:hypothetical protein
MALTAIVVLVGLQYRSKQARHRRYQECLQLLAWRINDRGFLREAEVVDFVRFYLRPSEREVGKVFARVSEDLVSQMIAQRGPHPSAVDELCFISLQDEK